MPRLPVRRVPGGSAANVLKGLASLAPASLSVAFVGMVGQDEAGWEYRQSITAHGVRPLLLESGTGAATAACLCLVTPDGQRTMRTALCAALELSSPQQLPRELAPPPPTDGGAGAGAGASGQPPIALLHCEGYCLYRVAMAAAAMRAARARGARVSLDLASFEVGGGGWWVGGRPTARRFAARRPPPSSPVSFNATSTQQIACRWF